MHKALKLSWEPDLYFHAKKKKKVVPFLNVEECANEAMLSSILNSLTMKVISTTLKCLPPLNKKNKLYSYYHFTDGEIKARQSDVTHPSAC